MSLQISLSINLKYVSVTEKRMRKERHFQSFFPENNNKICKEVLHSCIPIKERVKQPNKMLAPNLNAAFSILNYIFE